MKNIMSGISILILAATAQAVLVDDFESYVPGSTTSPWVVTDGTPAFVQESGGNMLLQSYGSYLSLGTLSIPGSNTATTLFFRLFKINDGTAPDCSIGLSDVADAQGDWTDFECYVTVVGGNLNARNGGGNTTILSPMTAGVWYNIWLVINNQANSYDVYVNTGGDASAGDLKANDFVFRKSTANPLVTFKIYGRSANGPVRVDDIYLASGVDLAVPSQTSQPAIIVSDPSDAAANETEAADFTAVFTTQTTPAVQWYKVSSPSDILMDPAQPNIDVQLSFDSLTEEYTSALSITNLSMADGGQYYCLINNESGYPQASAAADLVVYGLVAHWTLDQSSYADGCYQDEKGGYDAAVNGMPSFVNGADNLPNHAVQITPADGWALVPVLDPVQSSGQMTVSVWANWNQAPGTQEDLLAQSASGETLLVGNGLKAEGRWQHVCTVFDGSTGRLYVDGVLRDEGAWQLPADTQSAMNIGADENGQNAFIGSLDDVRVYNYAMTSLEVADERFALSNERSCILPFVAQYDFSGPIGAPDCQIDMYDLLAFADQWLNTYDLAEFAGLSSSWESSGLYPTGN